LQRAGEKKQMRQCQDFSQNLVVGKILIFESFGIGIMPTLPNESSDRENNGHIDQTP